MPPPFRFFLLCRDVSGTDLSDVINRVETSDGATQIVAVVGAVIAPAMKGKCLDLMFWKLGKGGELESHADYVGTPLILPEGIGPQVMPFDVHLPPLQRGIYGFDLFDRDGALGDPQERLATYLFESSAGPNMN